MGLIEKKDERDGYVYDAAIKGADTTFWSAVVGSIAADTTDVNKTLRIASARAHSFLQHIYGDYTFSLLVPAAPGATTAQTFGLRNPKDDTSASDTGLLGGGAYFSIDTDAVFKTVTYDDFGNSEETVVAWDTDWDGKQARYRITWEEGGVQFFVNDSVVATHAERIPTGSKSLEIRNATASNLDVAFVRVARAGAIV